MAGVQDEYHIRESLGKLGEMVSGLAEVVHRVAPDDPYFEKQEDGTTPFSQDLEVFFRHLLSIRVRGDSKRQAPAIERVTTFERGD